MGLEFDYDAFDRVRELYKQGISSAKISIAVGRPRRTVRRWIDRVKNEAELNGISKQEAPVNESSSTNHISDKTIITSYILGSKMRSSSIDILLKYAEEGYSVFIAPISAKSGIYKHFESKVLPELPVGIEWLTSKRIDTDLFTLYNYNGVRSTYALFKNAQSNVLVPSPYFEVHSTPVDFGDMATYVITTGTISSVESTYSNNYGAHTAKNRHREGYIKVDGNKVEQHTFESYGEDIKCIIFGDVHIPYANNDFLATVDALVGSLKPEFVVFHDYIDFSPVSHHTYSNIFAKAKRQCVVRHNEDIIKQHNQLVDVLKKHDVKSYLADSNHDVHFIKGLLSQSPDKLANMDELKLYFKVGSAYVDNMSSPLTAYLTAIDNNVELYHIDNVGVNNKLKAGGYILHNHGDSGVNGSLFSAKGVSSLGVKAVVGHSHTAVRFDDVLSVGTSSKLDLGYNAKGLSSWSDCNVVIQGDHAYHVINLKKGKQK